MTIAGRTARATSDHRFFAIASLAAFAIVFIGFARTYYLKAWFATPALPGLLHLHAALMTSWFALFFVQTSLIAAHRVRWHRRLGVAGGVLAVTIVVIGVHVAIRSAARDVRLPSIAGPPPLQFMGFLFFVLLGFAALVAAGLLLRRRPDYHKRLMLLSCLSMVGPGLFRIPLERVPALAFLRAGMLALELLLLYACVAYDTWRHRHLHPAFAVGSLLIIAQELPFIWMFLGTPTWARIATWLVS